MPRPPRIHVAGALYHTIARGNGGQKTFLDEKDYQAFVIGVIIGVKFIGVRSCTQFFYHNDHLGGVNVITDGSGARCQLNEYDPWGGDSRSEGATPGTPATCDPTHRFTGQELDPESGLYYYVGRYYDQEISRFVSPDPFVQSPDDPQNLNRYSYVTNNPQNYIDPSGYEGDPTCLPCWIVGGLTSLFWGDDDEDRKPIPRPKHRADLRRGHTNPENGGRSTLENVLVYDSQGSGGGETGGGTGGSGKDYPEDVFGGLRLTLVQALGGVKPANKGICPANQKRFFTNLYLYRSVADIAQTDVNFIMALSAQESGWNGPHSQELHNLFGTTQGGGRNLSYPSYQAAANAWANGYASWVRGASTINQFVDKLLNHVPPYNINLHGDYRTAIVGGQFFNGKTTIGTYRSVLIYETMCGITP